MIESDGKVCSHRDCKNIHFDSTKYCPSCKEKDRKRYHLRRKGTAYLKDQNRRSVTKYREKNRKLLLEKRREWAKNNPEKERERVQRRRARKLNAYIEDIDYLEVWNRDKGICGICQLPADPDNWHLDHIIPLSKGGEHSYSNTQVSHPLCNIKKGNKL